MKLSEAIKQITDQFGKDIIAEKRFVYMIADYYSFRDNPAEKRVLTALVDDGYTARLLDNHVHVDFSIIGNQIVEEVCKNYGFREEIVEIMVSNIMKGAGFDDSSSIIWNKTSTTLTNNIQEEKTIIKQKSNTIFRGEFSEEYIIDIFENHIKHLQYHAHMDVEKLQSLLSLEDEEAQRLFIFLRKIGVFKFNGFSEDYDLSIDSVHKLRSNYRLYMSRQKGFEVPLPSGKLISRSCLDMITQDLVKNRRTSVDIIIQNLSSLGDKRENVAKDLYQTLQRIRIIDGKGRNVSYLMPKAMADYIIRKLGETRFVYDI